VPRFQNMVTLYAMSDTWKQVGQATVLAVALFVAWTPAVSRAEGPVNLYDWIADLNTNNKRIKSEAANVAKAESDVQVARGDWFPELDTTASYGYEDQQKGEGVADTTLQPRVLDLTLTQKVYDFGGTNALIRAARLEQERAEVNQVAVRQSVIGEGVRAYLNLLRAQKLLNFSKASVENIKRQSALEDAKVDRGSGFSTDVLQAKRQLAGAEARRVRAEGRLKTAVNRFLAVFGELPPNVKMMIQPAPPIDLLPPTLPEAVDMAMKENPELLSAALQAQIQRASIDSTRSSSFFPEVNAIGVLKKENDVSGTVGHKTTSSVRIELTYNLNLGMTAVDTLKAAKQDHLSTEYLYGDARDRIEERVRSAWSRLETARLNAQFLNNQANIASEFLELARRERALGNRSLIDVLTGETELINATSDATSAEIDAAIAVYDLLTAMGRLELDVIPQSKKRS